MHMLRFFINGSGRGLTATRLPELDKAKKLFSQRIQKEKARKAA
jgi:hypothetical protein